MSYGGTRAHLTAPGLPPLVRAAAESAAAQGFEESCLPQHGRLLALLAAGLGPGVIGETGTGGGVGLAWLATGAAPGARLLSIERDPARAAAARTLFGPGVEVLTGDWTALEAYGPFDLLALDGGGQGKGTEPPLDVDRWLRPGGLVVLDDFTPSTRWPPLHQGHPDTARLHWLQHPHLLATELPLTPTNATLVGRRLPVSYKL